MIHQLQTIRTTQSGFEGIAALAAAVDGLSASKLELDFAQCGFFEANMAAALEAVLAPVRDKLNAVEIVRVPPAIETILCKNKFLPAYGYRPIQDSNRTTLPFQRLQLQEEGQFEEYLKRHMNGKGIPHMTASLENVFKKSIFEVFQNAVTHSGSRLGIFVCGQFYPQLQRLDLTIADAGMGIRENVRRFLQAKISSVEAIRWAMQEGNSTRTGKHPGGVGLKFLKDFIGLNKGKIQIASRFGFYQFQKGTEHFAKMLADFPGTAVNLEINTGDMQSYCLANEVSPDNVF